MTHHLRNINIVRGFKWVFILGRILLFRAPNVAHAEDGVAFSVKAVIPKNQHDLNQSYFDLRVEPGQVQEVVTMILNRSDKEIIVDVALNDASTNRNGVIIYDDPEAVVYREDALTDFAMLEQTEVTVQPGETESVFATISVPEEPFDGVVLGGLRFQERRNVNDEESEGVAILNEYAYVIGLQLSQNDSELEPLIELTDVEPGLSNSRTAVIATLKNMQPMILRDLAITAEVYEGDTLVKTASMEEVRIAPESSMDVVINWENYAIEAGDYSVELTASSEQGEWTFSEAFTITEEEEEEANEQAVVIVENTSNQNPDNMMPLYFIIVGLFVVVSIMLIYIIKTRMKLKHETQ
ncbi:DUF916 and DUF3324 domain-containing protein [Marinilactibacillus sp. Marseille-P9653]|uniref:DUF916 and DUF3324 domain-containing protein n=1 Tax=Marinilactibacillus sp. Marseille-P9653 TaxID=2866583 RepID=UPI001CE46F1E|nr:DUF916 and DUF3324 domain-containing protein [Marinilactibacillus sp. Marseille-P9653]